MKNKKQKIILSTVAVFSLLFAFSARAWIYNPTGTGGGGGNISGSILNGEVAWGSGVNTISGNGDFIYDFTQGLLQTFFSGNGTFKVDPTNQIYALGGYTGGGLGNALIIDNGFVGNFIKLQGSSGNRFLYDGNTGIYGMGDLDNQNNNTFFKVNDTAQNYVLNKLGGGGTKMVITDNSGVLGTQTIFSSVTTDSTLTGDGTGGNPLGVDQSANFNWTGTHNFSILPTSSAIPLSGTELVNKTYVDTFALGLQVRPSVGVATTGALSANTYNNGALGVGATLTENANGAIGNIDGSAVTLNERILVKNEATQANNGIYVATDLGSAGTPWILTRATDYDQSAEVTTGTFTSVNSGTVNMNTQWIMDTPGTIVMGTDPIHFSQFVTGIKTLNNQTGITQTFSNVNDTNITLGISSAANNHQFTVGWAGTLPYSRFTNGAGLSVAGRSTNSAGVQADIVGTTDQVLRVNTAGTTLGFGTIATGGITNNAVTYAKMQSLSAISKLLGSSSTTTPVQEITLGSNLSMSGTTLNASGGNSILFAQTANQTVGNTGTETTILGTGSGSLTLPTNFFSAGKSARIKISIGSFSTKNNPVGNLTIRLKYGATTLNTLTISNLPVSATGTATYEAVITDRTAGVSGTVVSSQALNSYFPTFLGNANIPTTTTTINTTTSNALNVTAQWATSSAQNSVTSVIATVESL